MVIRFQRPLIYYQTIFRDGSSIVGEITERTVFLNELAYIVLIQLLDSPTTSDHHLDSGPLNELFLC